MGQADGRHIAGRNCKKRIIPNYLYWGFGLQVQDAKIKDIIPSGITFSQHSSRYISIVSYLFSSDTQVNNFTIRQSVNFIRLRLYRKKKFHLIIEILLDGYYEAFLYYKKIFIAKISKHE